MVTDKHTLGRRSTTGNTGFASGGVTCKLGALCFYSSSVLVDSFVLRNPPERKARKRCTQLEVRNLINSRKKFVEKLELINGKWICFSSSLANEIC